MRRSAIVVLIMAFWWVNAAVAAGQQNAKSATVAAKRSPRVGLQEPDGFLGLKFGVALSSQLPQCVSSRYGEAQPRPEFCYAQLSTGELGYAELHQAPEIGLPYTGVVLLWHGDVEDICLVFANDNFPQMLRLLIAQFGKASAIDSVISEGDSGDMYYEGKVYKWSGHRVTIELSEYGDKPHESKVVFATNRYLRALHQ